jgi:tRNA threonylcarbamoyladenosine biosynthesis protein TsaE
MDIEVYTSSSEEETNRLGADFSRRMAPGDIVAFYGELGAGKTEFIKGICEGMEVGEIVSSPTYTIVNEYTGVCRRGGELEIYHIDLYRIESVAELVELGMGDILADMRSVKLIEWAENGVMILPATRYDIQFETIDENTRRIQIVHRDTATVESTGGMQRLFR